MKWRCLPVPAPCAGERNGLDAAVRTSFSHPPRQQDKNHTAVPGWLACWNAPEGRAKGIFFSVFFIPSSTVNRI
jgi:hypothetical protein